MRAKDESKVAKFLKTNDPVFIKACETSKINPTKRQASKWLNQKGIAFKNRFGDS